MGERQTDDRQTEDFSTTFENVNTIFRALNLISSKNNMCIFIFSILNAIKYTTDKETHFYNIYINIYNLKITPAIDWYTPHTHIYNYLNIPKGIHLTTHFHSIVAFIKYLHKVTEVCVYITNNFLIYSKIRKHQLPYRQSKYSTCYSTDDEI